MGWRRGYRAGRTAGAAWVRCCCRCLRIRPADGVCLSPPHRGAVDPCHGYADRGHNHDSCRIPTTGRHRHRGILGDEARTSHGAEAANGRRSGQHSIIDTDLLPHGPSRGHAHPATTIPATTIPATSVGGVKLPAVHLPGTRLPAVDLPPSTLPGGCVDAPQAFSLPNTTVRMSNYSAVDPKYAAGPTQQYSVAARVRTFQCLTRPHQGSGNSMLPDSPRTST